MRRVCSQAMYEEFPLAKARKAARIKMEKLKIGYMVTTYKKTEMTTIAEQRERIDWIRMRCEIIQFAQVMTERLKLKEKLTRLKVNVDYHTRELQSIEMEVSWSIESISLSILFLNPDDANHATPFADTSATRKAGRPEETSEAEDVGNGTAED